MRQKIIAILMDHNEDADYESETRLVDEGYIDSLELTAIILELEEAFGVKVEPSLIVPDNFNSVDAIAHMLRGCRSGV